MDQIAREAFYGVTDYKYQQKIQVALQEKAQKEHDAWVVAEKERVRAREQARIDAYNQEHATSFCRMRRTPWCTTRRRSCGARW